MDNRPIGIFDSGIGGLTCVREMNRLLPEENIVYFGDSARVPYGARSRETILTYAKQDIAFIRKSNVKMIIAACGTVSSVMGATKNIDEIPFTGVVFPAVTSALAVSRSKKIGLIGTPATIRSGTYEEVIHSIDESAVVTCNACPLFVAMAENGMTSPDDEVVKIMVERYLEPLKKAEVDTVILGCTHYPHFRKAIQNYMGDDVILIDTGAAAAEYARDVLTSKDMLTDRTTQGTNTFYSSDNAQLFEENAQLFLGGELYALRESKCTTVDIFGE